MTRQYLQGVKYVTFCTVCKQDDVGVHTSWNRRQADQTEEWRVARHCVVPRRSRREPRQPICTGTGIVVDPKLVFEQERATA